MVWQVTHYLCRYPPVAGSFFPLFPPRLSLSVSGWIKSLSHEGLAEIIQVSQGRVEGGVEIPQYSCSKGYSKFNGPEVVEKKGRSRRQASSFLHSPALWFALQPHSRKVPGLNPPSNFLFVWRVCVGFLPPWGRMCDQLWPCEAARSMAAAQTNISILIFFLIVDSKTFL